jgi:dolichyl-phosphate beta-glucosyltransferase
MSVSVILPVYNEASCIAQTIDQVVAFAAVHPEYQFIFVNDGSSDRTLEILERKLSQVQVHQIQLVSYRINRGKGYAVKAGMESSGGDYVCFLDSDLAYSLAYLERLVATLKHLDMAIGSRQLIPDSTGRVRFSRRVAGSLFNLLSRKMLGLNYRDMQAGIKGFRRLAAKHLFERQTIWRFCFDVELIYLACKYGYTIGEIPVVVSENHLYKPSTVNLWIDPLRMLANLLRIKVNDRLCLYGPMVVQRTVLPFR